MLICTCIGSRRQGTALAPVCACVCVLAERMAGVLAKEISGIRGFFRAREGHGFSPEPQLQKSFADSLIVMINGMRALNPHDATQLMEALNDNPDGEAQTRRIRDHIESKMQTGGSSPKPNGHASCKQTIKTWWNYLTVKEWHVFSNQNMSFNMKLTTLVERGMPVGCLEPDEQTFKCALATLLMAHYDEPPPPTHIYKRLKDVKQSWAVDRKAFDHGQVRVFPDEPYGLPDHILNICIL